MFKLDDNDEMLPLFEHDAFIYDKGYNTQALFYDLINVDLVNKGREPLYRLKKGTKRSIKLKATDYPLLRDYFIYLNDPTGYKFAILCLGGWEHFQKLMGLKWFSEIFDEWNNELEVKMRSGAIRSIMNEAVNGSGSGATSAAKWISDRNWVKTTGRPTKLSVDKERKIQASIRGEVDEDAKRLGLH